MFRFHHLLEKGVVEQGAVNQSIIHLFCISSSRPHPNLNPSYHKLVASYESSTNPLFHASESGILILTMTSSASQPAHWSGTEAGVIVPITHEHHFSCTLHLDSKEPDSTLLLLTHADNITVVHAGNRDSGKE